MGLTKVSTPTRRSALPVKLGVKNKMRTKFIILSISILLLIGCTSIGKIVEGHMVNNINGEKIQLTQDQLKSLNSIIEDSNRVLEKKLQVGNWIVVKNSNGKNVTIFSYSDRFFCVDDSSYCYKVKEKDLGKFTTVFGSQP